MGVVRGVRADACEALAWFQKAHAAGETIDPVFLRQAGVKKSLRRRQGTTWAGAMCNNRPGDGHVLFESPGLI